LPLSIDLLNVPRLEHPFSEAAYKKTLPEPTGAKKELSFLSTLESVGYQFLENVIIQGLSVTLLDIGYLTGQI
jgi:hypothetical protein